MKRTTFTPAHEADVRQAATLVLMRDGPSGPEVFMMRRPDNVDFGGMHVFPGGKVDPRDRSAELGQLVVGLEELSGRLDRAHATDGLAYWVAAARECFEECGVLMAVDGQGWFNPENHTKTQLAALRSDLRDGHASIHDVCNQLGVRLVLERVHFFSHWFTPEGPPRRYDTRFFLAEMPPGQVGVHDNHELVDSEWVRPDDALRRWRAGELQCIFPTHTTLASLEGYASVAELVEAVEAGTHLPEWTEQLGREGMQRIGRGAAQD